MSDSLPLRSTAPRLRSDTARPERLIRIESSRITPAIASYLDAVGRDAPEVHLHRLAMDLVRSYENKSSGGADLGKLTEPVPLDWYTTAPPRRAWLLRDRRTTSCIDPDGNGVLPLGKVGLLVASGGIGKTMLLCQLAVAVATATPFLGTWAPDASGRVLLLLGEEDGQEAWRRLYRAVKIAGAEPPSGSIHVAALAGKVVSFLQKGPTGEPVETPAYASLLAFVLETGPWSLIVVDPLSRFAGGEAEKDNAVATRFVETLEQLAQASGATVLAAHHKAQWARKTKAADEDATGARGVTGITDACRWVATVTSEKPKQKDEETDDVVDLPAEIITLAVVKSNYARRGEPILLRRDEEHGGTLVPLDALETDLVEGALQAASPAGKRAASEIAKTEASKARCAADDVAASALWAANPGASLRSLKATLIAQLGCGTDRAQDALSRTRPNHA